MNRPISVSLAIAGVFMGGWLLVRESPLAGQAPKEAVEGPKEKDPRKISTAGSATVRVKPNRARLFLAVQTTAPTVKKARASNKQDVEKIIAAIQGLKITDLKMKSTNVQMDVIHAKQEKQTTLPEVLGYRVNYTFTVLLSGNETDKLSAAAAKVLDTALENGANTLEQIVFFRDDLTDARREALTLATKDAVANAGALATGAGRKLADIISIDSNPEYGQVNTMSNNSDLWQRPGGTSTELVAGDVEVTCRVTVTATYGAAK
jgi:uncharacterized protein YggE